MTTAQNLRNIFEANLTDGCFGFSPLKSFLTTEFQKASKAAFDADYEKTSGGAWTYGDVEIESVAIHFGGTKKFDADGTEYMVFPDGSALAYEHGGPVHPVTAWIRNENMDHVD